jgi:hypothetical protein
MRQDFGSLSMVEVFVLGFVKEEEGAFLANG